MHPKFAQETRYLQPYLTQSSPDKAADCRATSFKILKFHLEALNSAIWHDFNWKKKQHLIWNLQTWLFHKNFTRNTYVHILQNHSWRFQVSFSRSLFRAAVEIWRFATNINESLWKSFTNWEPLWEMGQRQSMSSMSRFMPGMAQKVPCGKWWIETFFCDLSNPHEWLFGATQGNHST